MLGCVPLPQSAFSHCSKALVTTVSNVLAEICSFCEPSFCTSNETQEFGQNSALPLRLQMPWNSHIVVVGSHVRVRQYARPWPETSRVRAAVASAAERREPLNGVLRGSANARRPAPGRKA